MKPPRGLSAEEAAAWEQVAATVKPLNSDERLATKASHSPSHGEGSGVGVRGQQATTVAHPHPASPSRGRSRLEPGPGHGLDSGLDSHWERRFKAGSLAPDFTLDLHGHGLDAAYDRLMSGVAQARAMGARTILLVTGKSRPVDPADRGTARGAIRAKVLDWLAASSHHAAIAAVRKAHPRHGGEGALYIVLKRER